MAMHYISTRGRAPRLSFDEVVLTGLASDGGLYLPEQLPTFDSATIAKWAALDYRQLAFEVMYPFVEGCVPADDFKQIIDRAYRAFVHPAIAPLVQLDHNEWVLELHRGPTLAFKDFALQFLGQLLDYLLERRQQRVVIMGATSGDTGSAAIEGCRRCANLDVFILHPHNRVSPVQRRQMTTVLAPNVFNIALEGNFDDCQNLVKASFADQSFLPEGRQLVAVNSINWARIMAQIVYYFYAALHLGAPHRPVSFSVPTGNFGDIFAGYLARKMGLPVAQLIVATNQNDILHRCLASNDHTRQPLAHTLSPSMDIMVSSNFERLLFDLHGRDGGRIENLMQTFRQTGAFELTPEVLTAARAQFDSFRLDDAGTTATIAEVFKRCEYLLDPHTAIGVAAGRQCRRSPSVPMICLATAHPAKFAEAVAAAQIEVEAALPPHLADLHEREESYAVLPHDLAKVHQYMAEQLAK